MPITDLTGYQWVANNVLTRPNGESAVVYSINFTCGGNDFNTLGFPPSAFNNTMYYGGSVDTNNVYNFNSSSWSSNAYKTIEITGGTDATNSTLIAWLEANGTLTAPIQANTYTLTHTLTNLTKGNITIQITPDTNYTYPTSLTITNGTIVSYDNTTGIAVINGDDTTIVSGECVEQVSGYSVSGQAVTANMFGNEAYQYSIDDGTTWNNFTLLENDLFTPITTTQIKFRVKLFSGMARSAIVSTTLNCNIGSNNSTYVYSPNYILDQNVNDVTLAGRFE